MTDVAAETKHAKHGARDVDDDVGDEEDDDEGYAEGGGKWMQKAFSGSHGQFKAKAEKAGMSTGAYASKVAKSPSASTHEKRQANLAKLGMKYGKR
jgi:hypothetical protein